MANPTTHYQTSGWFFIVGIPSDKEIDLLLNHDIIGYLLPNFQFAGEC